MLRIALLQVLLFLLVSAGPAQDNAAAKLAREWRETHERAIIDEFVELLSIPNIAADNENIRRNAALLMRMLERRGAKAQLLESGLGPPAVFGAIDVPGATRTVVYYAHYDGQPADAKEWPTPPFEPVLKDGDTRVALPAVGQRFDPEWRLYGRSTSDDKGTIIAMLAALDALQSRGLKPKSNVRFFFEGEEEASSAGLGAILRKYKDMLKADLWFMCDGPVNQTRKQQVTFGARGIAVADLTVYGPKRELHSGHYGNWAPNPAMMLAQLLASMKEVSGRVTIKDYYSGIEPLGETEKQAIAAAPEFDDELRRELLLATTDNPGRKLLELYNEPSLNVRGMAAAGVGAQARNVIPARATAAIDMRLVKGITPEMAFGRLTAHVEAQGYFVTASEPEETDRLKHARVARLVMRDGYPASRTSMDLPISQEVLRVVESARGETVKIPTSGGTTPQYIIDQVLGAPVIGIPIANHDNNQHSSNENIRIRNLWDGIELMSALLGM